jgi:hypothetical protein
LTERPWTEEKLPFQPALLHVEVVPFIYGNCRVLQGGSLFIDFCSTDCFEVKIDKFAPALSSELLHVLGAIASGAQVFVFLKLFDHKLYKKFVLANIFL